MTTSLFVLWAVTGWCGNELFRIKIPKEVFVPEPRPKPNWLVLRTIGAVTGLIGGFVFSQVFGSGRGLLSLAAKPEPEPWITAVFAAATAVGAFVAARFVTDIYEQLSGSR